MKTLAWIFVGAGVFSCLLVGLSLLGRSSSHLDYEGNENKAAATMKTIAAAEAAFRDVDPECDGVRRYWREDVATLYAMIPGGSTEMIQLIDLSTAKADIAPADPWWHTWPTAGYWYAALLFEDEVVPDPKRFAFCAVPDIPEGGRFVYAVTQEGVIWQKPARGARDLPACFPLDPAKGGWRKAD